MGFLNFLRPPTYRDPLLGDLVYRGRYWRGVISLGSEGGVPLLLGGARAAPAETSLELARELGQRYTTLRPTIASALFEHYEPYSEAMASGEEEQLPEVPRLSRPEQVWGHVSLVRVLIERLGGVDTVELAYRTEWDAEHTLGARFQKWTLRELNGSVI